jgi:hypothetical protein
MHQCSRITKVGQPGLTHLSAILTILIGFSAVATAARADVFIYPAKGQSQERQDKDRYECHTWAVGQTGFDPSRAASTSTSAALQQKGRSQPHILRGGARGAAMGAVGGAIAGDPGKGAAAGAAMGGLAGGFRRMDARKKQAHQQQTSVQPPQQSQRTAYDRAMAACLEGRGYTIK